MPAPPLSLRIHRFAQYPLFVLILFCRAPASPHTSHVSTLCRLYSSWQCRGAHFPALSFHVEQRLCRPPKPQCLSAFWLFMHIYASYFMLCTALHCQPCRFATILFRRCRLPLAAKTDLVFATAALHFLVQPSSPFIAFAVGAPSSPFALNSSIDLLFALTADAFCLRRILPSCPAIAALCLGYAFSFSLFPTLPFCLTALFFYYIII